MLTTEFTLEEELRHLGSLFGAKPVFMNSCEVFDCGSKLVVLSGRGLVGVIDMYSEFAVEDDLIIAHGDEFSVYRISDKVECVFTGAQVALDNMICREVPGGFEVVKSYGNHLRSSYHVDLTGRKPIRFTASPELMAFAIEAPLANDMIRHILSLMIA